jgi:hypothetical protein
MYWFTLGESNVKGARQVTEWHPYFTANGGQSMLSDKTPVGGFRMQRKYSGLLAAVLLVAGLPATAVPGLAQNKSEGSTMPKVGDVAPDFTLKYFDGANLKDVKLSDYRGKKNVVVAFYIFAFTGG